MRGLSQRATRRLLHSKVADTLIWRRGNVVKNTINGLLWDDAFAGSSGSGDITPALGLANAAISRPMVELSYADAPDLAKGDYLVLEEGDWPVTYEVIDPVASSTESTYRAELRVVDPGEAKVDRAQWDLHGV